jgi:hypothetical protein
MSTAEGGAPRGESAPRNGENRDRRGDLIGVGGGDDSVSRIQLAARWAEAYGDDSDSLVSVLKRFRTAYDYVDAVIHGVDPPDLEPEAAAEQPAPSYAQQPPWSSPAPTPPEGTAPPAEPRPWP